MLRKIFTVLCWIDLIKWQTHYWVVRVSFGVGEKKKEKGMIFSRWRSLAGKQCLHTAPCIHLLWAQAGWAERCTLPAAWGPGLGGQTGVLLPGLLFLQDLKKTPPRIPSIQDIFSSDVWTYNHPGFRDGTGRSRAGERMRGDAVGFLMRWLGYGKWSVGKCLVPTKQ